MNRLGRRGFVFVSLMMGAVVSQPINTAAAYRESSTVHVEVSTRIAKPPAPTLPKKLSEPIRYAYSPCGDFGKTCGVWHVVTTSGKQWTVRDALPDEDLGKIAVSPDGVRLAYVLAKSERLVIRDLKRGTVRVVPTPKSWEGSEMSFGFSRNSRWLAVDSIGGHPKSRAIRYDVKTAKVLTLPRACCVIGISDVGTTFVAVHKDSAKTTEASAVRPGRTSKVCFPILPYLMLSKTHVSPDGHLLAFDGEKYGVPSRTVGTLDAKTGQIVSRVTPDIDGLREIESFVYWYDTSRVLIHIETKRYEPQLYLVDVHTGRAERVLLPEEAFDLHSVIVSSHVEVAE
ncbi:hypothetical protein [Streptosporangium amethystogenes]|uniref:hypothetical protein n=1 Tax=Streptosporangium amethystogenes TaxID=2002 RepID=UPI0012FAF6BE|nr:hypothetical protein [Streptosporangium amethystogenes]